MKRDCNLRYDLAVHPPVSMKSAKKNIPKALREQVWLATFGKTFQHSCFVHWCTNKINVFDFHVGHDKPESKGGSTELSNLKPICSRCNQSMGNRFTIQEWNRLYASKTTWFERCKAMFRRKAIQIDTHTIDNKG